MTNYTFENLDEWTNKIEDRLETVFRKISLDAFTEVILKTPVDRGRARGSWDVSIGRVPTGAVELNDKTGTATIGKVQAEVLGLKSGQTIYLISNLAYIRKLEEGWSGQAPNGMVKLTVQRFQKIADAATRELSKG